MTSQKRRNISWLLLIVGFTWQPWDSLTYGDEIIPLPPVDSLDTSFFEKIRFAALGDPQDLTEPLLPDDVAPPGQPRQENNPPGRKLPPGAKPGALQQLILTTTELPRLGSNGLGLATLDMSLTLGMPAPTVD